MKVGASIVVVHGEFAGQRGIITMDSTSPMARQLNVDSRSVRVALDGAAVPVTVPASAVRPR